MRRLLLVWACLFSGLLSAQQIYISRVIPGWYKGNDRHQVELFNPSPKAVDISGWLLSTQEYCFLFPKGTRIPGQSVFAIGNNRGNYVRPQIDLERSAGLIVRSNTPVGGGNYVVLLDRNSVFVDGMYFSPFQDVPFLPENGRCALPGDKVRVFNFPDESDPFWEGRGLALAQDPALHFIQIGKVWVPTAANVNLLTAVEFGDFSVEYSKGVAELDWGAWLEVHSLSFVIEKSEDGEHFVAAAEIPAVRQERGRASFSWRDDAVEEGKTYYYRIRNQDIFGNEVLGGINKIEAREESGDFALDVFWGPGKQGEELNVRFYSREGRKVRIKLVDAYFREVILLFDAEVAAEERNLIKVTEPLAKGRYLLIADTGIARVTRDFTVNP